MAGCVAGRGAHSSPSHRARGRPPAGFPRAAPPPGLAPAGPPGTPPARTPPSPGSPTSASSREPLFSSRAGPSGLRALGLLSSVWPTPALLTVSFPELSHRLFFLPRRRPWAVRCHIDVVQMPLDVISQDTQLVPNSVVAFRQVKPIQ